MTAEALYQLVKNLSSDDRNIISRGLGVHRNGKLPGYALLFKRLTNIIAWNEEAELKVRGEELKRPDVYSHTRNDLLDRIILILVQREGNQRSIEYVKKALAFDAVDLAQKALVTALEKSLENENFFIAQAFYLLHHETFHNYKIKLLPPPLLAREHVLKMACQIENKLSEFMLRLNEAKRASKRDKIFRVREMFITTSQFRSEFETQNLRIQLFKVRLLIHQDKEQEALIRQEELIERVLNSKLPLGKRMRELSLLVHLHSNLGNFSQAMEWTFKLGGISGLSVQDKKLKEWLFCSASMVLANNHWNLDFAGRAMKITLNTSTPISDNQKALFLYTAALVAFGNFEFEQAEEWLGKIIQIPKRYRPSMTWQPYFLKTIILHSKGETIDSSYRSAMRYAQKQPTMLPKVALKMVRSINNSALPIRQEKIDQWKQEIESLLDNIDEAQENQFFDVLLWLESIRLGKSMKEVDFQGRKSQGQGPEIGAIGF